jgi:hypothetical protein
MKSTCTLRALLIAFPFAACSHVQLSEREQMQVNLRYQNVTFQLAQSMWVGPFFRDDSRRLLSRMPPGEDVLLQTPEGKPIAPGPATGVLPAGTKMTVLRVSFPTSWDKVTRPILTPRDQPWVELAVNGKAGADAILLLSPGLPTLETVFEEVSHYLSEKPVQEEVAALPPADQRAVETKELAAGISQRAVELAFGMPNFRHVYGEGASRIEDWTWYTDTTIRSVHLKDGVLDSFDVKKKSTAPTSDQSQ